MVNFSSAGDTELSLIAKGQNITISNLSFDDITGLSLPSYTNISAQAGLVDERSLKYGGPSIADIDNDGDYDFVLNNHNDAYSKLFWNNNDGTVTKHNKDLALWNQMDLHGSACVITSYSIHYTKLYDQWNRLRIPQGEQPHTPVNLSHFQSPLRGIEAPASQLGHVKQSNSFLGYPEMLRVLYAE